MAGAVNAASSVWESVRNSSGLPFIILELMDAAISASEMTDLDTQLKLARYDRYHPRVEAVQKLLDAAGKLDGSSPDVLPILRQIQYEQGELFTRYLVARALLDRKLYETAQVAYLKLIAARRVRERATDAKWVDQNLDQALQDYEDYLRAFDDFVDVISDAFGDQS